MKSKFEIIEHRIAYFFENNLLKPFGINILARITKDIISIFEQKQKTIDGEVFSPNKFIIHIHSNMDSGDGETEEWKNFINNLLLEYARELGVKIPGPFIISILCDYGDKDKYKIEFEFSAPFNKNTINLKNNAQVVNKQHAGNFSLVLPNDEVFHLNKPLISIGRSHENDVVIDNLRVSRIHAQIRIVNGKHKIFDADSNNGTKVNGEKISQKTLSNGDVIEISDVPIIFWEEISEKNPPKPNRHTKTL